MKRAVRMKHAVLVALLCWPATLSAQEPDAGSDVALDRAGDPPSEQTPSDASDVIDTSDTADDAAEGSADEPAVDASASDTTAAGDSNTATAPASEGTSQPSDAPSSDAAVGDAPTPSATEATTPAATAPAAATPDASTPAAATTPGAATNREEEAKARAQHKGPNIVKVHKDERGFQLMVDGKPMMVFGMNWGYMPIGQNYTYDFWGQPEDVIIDALDAEMTWLQEMGINAIRQYLGIPPKWITYIYEKYGIYTMLNHSLGAYGVNVDGSWIAETDYSDPRTREILLEEMTELVEEYKNTPGLLMWLLGNENNYRLLWSSNEIENLPKEQQGDSRAKHLYSLFGEITKVLHDRDPNHPVSLTNGDVLYLEVIAKECPNVDIYGSNVYRGYSSRDIFEVTNKLGMPFMYTEFGSDAYDAKRGREDDVAQAKYLQSLWQEIYEQSYGKGRVGNAIGGMIFQWSDGWWKYKQTENLDVHDETASWSNQAFMNDWTPDGNNMNEEWFGIAAKGHSDERGIYEVYPRSAYYLLKDAFKLDPYAPGTTIQKIRQHFGSLGPRTYKGKYEASQVTGKIKQLERFRVSRLRLDFETYTTGGQHLTEREREPRRFDHTESVYLGVEAKPFRGVRAELVINALGNVATNPINEIFFESRGIREQVRDEDGDLIELTDLERFKIYQATFEWDHKYFNLEGFYRSGHYHWGYEGDFFGLYPEANYQPDIDLYNADAPIGMVLTGKGPVDGLKIAAGPQIYWGANPMVIGKYYKDYGKFKFSILHQEEVAQQGAGIASSVIPQPRSRRTTLYGSYTWGKLRFELGGIMAGTRRINRRYEIARQADEPTYLESGYYLLEDKIRFADTLGMRAKLTLDLAPFHWYIQGGYRGLVSDAGGDPTLTITGWTLKESGQGNHWAVSTGAAYYLGNFVLAPNILLQKPLEGPLPLIGDFFDADTGRYFPGVQARNQLQDPFWVRSNRETYGFEFLLAFDPTPATFMWAWDNIEREDAPFSASLNFVYKMHPTSQDAHIGVTQDGIVFAFSGSVPARDLWETNLRMIANFTPDLKLVNWITVGQGQARGDDPRLVTRFSSHGRLTYKHLAVNYHLKIDDWGPYDYHKDFNLTFPIQVMLDLGYSFQPAKWFAPTFTRFGVRGQYRTLDQFSNRYRFSPADPNRKGNEWEIKTYVQFSL